MWTDSPAQRLTEQDGDSGKLISGLKPDISGYSSGSKREWMVVEAPFTGGELGSVPRCGTEDVAEAARRARLAQRSWKNWSFSDRARIFFKLHDLLLDRQEEVLDLLQMEAGKARIHAFEEVLDSALVSRYYANTGEEHLRAKSRQGAFPVLTQTREYHRPKGLAGFIVPWNYPLTLSITDAIPALMAGNAALIKPDSQTPFTTLWAIELLRQAGLPRDLVQVVTGSGSELGGPLIENVDFLMFTGSTATGRIVAEQAARRLIDYSLELGGKNAMIVCGDADLGKAAEGAIRACYSAAGQLCVSVERLYVNSSVYEEFTRRFVEKVENLKLDARIGYGADMGSLVSADQLRTVEEHVSDAVEKGAKVLAGGRRRPDIGPYFYEPTVLSGASADMELFAEETFGPVVAIQSFDATEEAIEKANDSPYGLSFSVWTREADSGKEIASSLEAGAVNVNEAYAATWASTDAPLGGFKDSGTGRRHGAEGILKYTEAQTVSTQRLLPVAPPPGVSDSLYAKAMTASLRLLKKAPFIK